MKQQITIDGVTLTRAQVEAAYAALQEPGVPKVDRTQPVTDRVTVRGAGLYIQVPMQRVRHVVDKDSNASAPYFIIYNNGAVAATGHVPDDHDLPSLTGFTSAPKETR